ncbi:hypothetical protein [Streptomyces sp. SID3343]|uniref:hypothetical protein n=1 Tax=Streptomyces sp. SID3343 TaxID=2690260 RepID=UPI00136ACA3C|nr:hypothetical protein [Streptomyces sp. SID3343]
MPSDPPPAAIPTAIRTAIPDATVEPAPPPRPRSAIRRLAAPLVVLVLALTAFVAFGSSLGRPGSGATLPHSGQTSLGKPLPGTATPVAPAHGPVAADIQRLADDRTQALATHDQTAFVADLAADDPGLVEGQLRLFRNLMRVPFDYAAYRVETVQTMPATDDRLIAYVDVSFDHRVTNADTATVGEGYRWTVLRATPGAPLHITAVDGTPYDGAGYAYARDFPAPWDHAELTVVRRDHVIVLADPATGQGAEQLADDAEDAARADLDMWADGGPAGTAPGFVIVPVADRATFYRLYGGRTGEHGEESGLTYALRTTEPAAKGRFGGARIVLDTTSGWFTSPNPERLGELLRHEMAHALVTPLRTEVPNQDQPVWVVEGFADWLALRGDALAGSDQLNEARTYVSTNRFTGRLPTDGELYQADTVGNAAAYEFAHLAIRRIETIGGGAAVYAFVTAVYADPAPAAVDAAIEKTTGRPREVFEKEWAAEVQNLVAS